MQRGDMYECIVEHQREDIATWWKAVTRIYIYDNERLLLSKWLSHQEACISLLDGLPAIYWQHCFSLYQLVNTYVCVAVEKWLNDISCSYQLCQWLVFCVHWELVCHVMSWNIYITHAWAAILLFTLGGATRSRVRIIALLYLASYHYRKLV